MCILIQSVSIWGGVAYQPLCFVVPLGFASQGVLQWREPPGGGRWVLALWFRHLFRLHSWWWAVRTRREWAAMCIALWYHLRKVARRNGVGRYRRPPPSANHTSRISPWRFHRRAEAVAISPCCNSAIASPWRWSGLQGLQLLWAESRVRWWLAVIYASVCRKAKGVFRQASNARQHRSYWANASSTFAGISHQAVLAANSTLLILWAYRGEEVAALNSQEAANSWNSATPSGLLWQTVNLEVTRELVDSDQVVLSPMHEICRHRLFLMGVVGWGSNGLFCFSW